MLFLLLDVLGSFVAFLIGGVYSSSFLGLLVRDTLALALSHVHLFCFIFICIMSVRFSGLLVPLIHSIFFYL